MLQKLYIAKTYHYWGFSLLGIFKKNLIQTLQPKTFYHVYASKMPPHNVQQLLVALSLSQF